MKKLLKNNKGFSLVELLIALLIMAVIAGTAITLFGGVLETSKGGADRETAESIRRAILTYMNASNDTALEALQSGSGSNADANLIDSLSKKIEISKSGGSYSVTIGDGSPQTVDISNNVVEGTFGPFLEDGTVKPQQSGMTGWDISIDSVTQKITVKAAAIGNLEIITP